MFGETVESLELAPEGTGYRTGTRFSKFHNLPELISMFKECADIQTADMLDLSVPDVEYETVVLKPSRYQEEYIENIGKSADRIHNGQVESRKDNMLKVTSDGRKAALDQRLINPMLPESPDSKANACVEKAITI